MKTEISKASKKQRQITLLHAYLRFHMKPSHPYPISMFNGLALCLSLNPVWADKTFAVKQSLTVPLAHANAGQGAQRWEVAQEG